MKRSEKIQERIKESVPEFRIRFKDESSGFYSAIFWLASLFNKRFMTDFTTVLGKTIWFPNKGFMESDDNRTFSILSHEYVHLEDNKRFGILFSISYLFPQILSVFSVLSLFSFFSLSFLWFLCFLVFLLPFPSYFRRMWEIRGYTVSMYIDYKLYGSFDSSLQNQILKNLTGWEYYKTSWSRDTIKEAILKSKESIKSNKFEGAYAPPKKVIEDVSVEIRIPLYGG